MALLKLVRLPKQREALIQLGGLNEFNRAMVIEKMELLWFRVLRCRKSVSHSCCASTTAIRCDPDVIRDTAHT